MPARPGNCSGSSSVKACVEPESNHTSSTSRTCSHFAGSYFGLQEALGSAGGEPGVGAFLGEGVGDGGVDGLIAQDVAFLEVAVVAPWRRTR